MDPTLPLPWAPPTLTAPRVVTISDDPATRNIQLEPGQDCFITAPEPVHFNSSQDKADGIIQIFGGGDVVWIGGEIVGEGGPITEVTGRVTATDTFVRVKSTDGFPTSRYIRVDGEGTGYTGKTPTAFLNCVRNEIFYNPSVVSSSTTHEVGATVWLGEYSRTGISRVAGTGHTHLEGILFSGFINDIMRANRNSPSLTIQNCRGGPNTNWDHAYQRDGHPDGLQLWQGGVQELRIARTTLMAGQSGRAILNAAKNTDYPAVGKVVLRDVDMVAAYPDSRPIENADAETVWEVSNSWLRAYLPKSYVCQDAGLAEKLGFAEVISDVPDFCPVGVPGVGYVSPGYV